MVYLLIIGWVLLFSVIYAFLLSNLFGIKKWLDKWILFFLHNVTWPTIFLIWYGGPFSALNEPVSMILNGILAILIKTVLDGLVWEFYLRDRKLNGFLTALIISVIYLGPTLVWDLVG